MTKYDLYKSITPVLKPERLPMLQQPKSWGFQSPKSNGLLPDLSEFCVMMMD